MAVTAVFAVREQLLVVSDYCFYEILDNVLIHSGKDLGTVITHYDAGLKFEGRSGNHTLILQ